MSGVGTGLVAAKKPHRVFVPTLFTLKKFAKLFLQIHPFFIPIVTPQQRTISRIVDSLNLMILFFYPLGSGDSFASGVGTESAAAKMPHCVLVPTLFTPFLFACI